MSGILYDQVDRAGLRTDLPAFRSGDIVKVHTKVKEGSRERIQIFEGMVIQRKNSGIRETFTVRKNSFGVGVEKIFPLHSPQIARIDVVKTGKVKQSRIFYMRDRSGKNARLRERELPGQGVVAEPTDADISEATAAVAKAEAERKAAEASRGAESSPATQQA